MRSILEFIANHKPSKPIDDYKYHPNTKDKLIENIITELNRGNIDLNCIDTSAITDMSNLFLIIKKTVSTSKLKNLDISKWNVSKVSDVSFMFGDCKKFEGKGLEAWNVSNVKDMSYMFYGCEKFNVDLSKWDISNVENEKTNVMFYDCPLKDIYGISPKRANGKLIKL